MEERASLTWPRGAKRNRVPIYAVGLAGESDKKGILLEGKMGMKKALLLCASHNDLGLIRGLRKLGYYIISIGNIPGMPGEKYVDQYIRMDYSDKEQVLKLARTEQIDAICQCCNDFGVYTASYVAEQMGLPGYDSYETTLILHNKDLFKAFAQENDIIIPEFHSFSEEKRAIEWVGKQKDYPLIVKPVDASAGNGIHKINSLEEGVAAIENAFFMSREKRVIIEKYIEGTQHGFCTFLVNQKVVAVATNNEYSILNPYRVEIDTFPADGEKRVRDMLIHQIEKMAGLLHLKDGIFHLQYIMDQQGPKIIEVMRRILGNMYSVPANQLCGFDWDYWEIRAKCGLSCDGFPSGIRQEGYYAYKTLLAGKNGVIHQINVPDKYEKYIYNQFIIKKPGDKITNYLSQPVGLLFMQFSSAEEMYHVLIRDYDTGCVIMKEV